MKAAVSLVVLAAAFPVSYWVANRVAATKPGESPAEHTTRVARRIVTAMGTLIAGLLVMVFWMQAQNIQLRNTSEDTDRAIALALANAEANCQNLISSQERFERGLVADVRLATANLNAATNDLQQAQERLDAPVPDFSNLPPEFQSLFAAAVEQGRQRSLHERDRADADVDAFQIELANRQATLDEHRSATIDSCPVVEPDDSVPPVPTLDD